MAEIVDIGAVGGYSNYAGIGFCDVAGTSVPADGRPGFAPGCVFRKVNGTGGAVLYVNVGTKDSCNFDPFGVTAGSITVDAIASASQIAVTISGVDIAVFNGTGLEINQGYTLQVDTIVEGTDDNGVKVEGVLVRDGNVFPTLGTPAAKTGVATITIADMLTGLVTLTHATGATVALTLDTGAAMDIGKPAAFATNNCIDWSLTNLSAAALDTGTVTASLGHTIIGAAVVPSAHSTTIASSTMRFRTKRTAADTWITYRIG